MNVEAGASHGVPTPSDETDSPGEQPESGYPDGTESEDSAAHPDGGSAYAGGDGVDASKTSARVGKKINLYWAWLDEAGERVSTSDDAHTVRIESCQSDEAFLELSGMPGASGLSYHASQNRWKFRWDTGDLGPGRYCVVVINNSTGQELTSPEVFLR